MVNGVVKGVVSYVKRARVVIQPVERSMSCGHGVEDRTGCNISQWSVVLSAECKR